MQVLGGYSLIAAVGVGSTGTVWRAVQTDLGRPAAVKILALGIDQELLRAEARVLASLDHPNIVKVYDFVAAGEQSPEDPGWLAEEWVDGERIDELVTRLERRLTAEQGLGVTRGALMGLAHAHECGVIHGDVAAGNVLVGADGTSKLIDFGLASPIGSTSASGTPAFVSPEAAQGLPGTPASDVYSAAALLYFLLDGQPPFGSSGTDSLIEKHISEPPPRLREHGDQLASVIERAMAKNPGDRPPDAAAFLAELEDAARERYGVGWLARASVAGLAAAPAAVVAVEEALGGSAAPGGQAATAIVTGTSSDANRGGRPRSWKPMVAAAVTIAVIAGVIVAVAASGGSSKKTPVAAVVPAPITSAPPASTAPPTPAVPSAVTLSKALAGKLSVTLTVVASNDPDIAVGKVVHRTWTISSACSAVPCRLTIASSSGSKLVGLLSGDKLTIKIKSTAPGTCVDDTTGQVIPNRPVGTASTGYYVINLQGVERGQITLSGASIAQTVVTTNPTNCRPFAPRNVNYTIVGKQI